MTFEDSSHQFDAQLHGALDWWREAGVDYDYSPAPQSWLSEESKQAAGGNHAKAGAKHSQTAQNGGAKGSSAGAEEPRRYGPGEGAAPGAEGEEKAPNLGGDPKTWPSELGAFQKWWMSEESLEMGGFGPRIAPRGAANPALMVIVAEPEEGDSERLLSGPQGALIDNMLRAMGINEGESYIAAALPRHIPSHDLAMLESRGLGKILRHHIDLAAPQRILVLGHNILPLLGHNMAQETPGGAGVLQEFYQGQTKAPVMITSRPITLLTHTARRAALWRAWLDWTAES